MTQSITTMPEILNRPHIIVVDDDRRIRELISRYLDQNGFIVTLAENAAVARQLLHVLMVDAVILDVMMPGENGISFMQSLAKENFRTPVLFLTAKTEIDDRISGLEAGADDYLAKPFEPRELVLRLNAILKRSAMMPQSGEQTIAIDGWHYDDKRTLLRKGDQVQPVTRAEANLLAIFLAKPNTVFSRQELAQLTNLEGQERTVDVQVTRLRRKIEPDPKKPRYLQTVRGEGYILYVD